MNVHAVGHTDDAVYFQKLQEAIDAERERIESDGDGEAAPGVDRQPAASAGAAVPPPGNAASALTEGPAARQVAPTDRTENFRLAEQQRTQEASDAELRREATAAQTDMLGGQGKAAQDAADVARRAKEDAASKVPPQDGGLFSRTPWHQRGVNAVRSVLSRMRSSLASGVREDILPVAPESIAEAAQHDLDLTGYSHMIDGSAVVHAREQHGDAAKEKARGQMAITDADFERIPEVLSSPDKTIYGMTNRLKQPLIGYLKTFPDGTTIYLEEVRSGAKRLSMNTMRKYPATTDVPSVLKSVRLNVRNDGRNALTVVQSPQTRQYSRDAAFEIDPARTPKRIGAGGANSREALSQGAGEQNVAQRGQSIPSLRAALVKRLSEPVIAGLERAGKLVFVLRGAA